VPPGAHEVSVREHMIGAWFGGTPSGLDSQSERLESNSTGEHL
jgi:hypothetical protein